MYLQKNVEKKVAVVYIVKCRYEIEEKSFGMVYRHIPTHFEHWVKRPIKPPLYSH
jgi:hypothetical protein